MNEVIKTIQSAQNQSELYKAGELMRSYLRDADDAQVKDRIIDIWKRKSKALINTKPLSRQL